MAEITRKIGIDAVNTAVITRLKTDANTIAYAAKIFNNVPGTPSAPAMPYIHVTGYLDRPSAMFSSRDFAPEDVSFQAHVWSEYAGDKEAATYMDNICRALTNAALSITGYTTLYNCVLEFADILTDNAEPARPVRHGVLRFLIRVCP